MTYNVTINRYAIPLTGLWCGTNEWCKAGDVAHLCSIMATMYHALNKLAGSEGISETQRIAVDSALSRAREVIK